MRIPRSVLESAARTGDGPVPRKSHGWIVRDIEIMDRKGVPHTFTVGHKATKAEWLRAMRRTA